VTPHLYNTVTMYQYQQHQQLQQQQHLLTRPLLLCHRLPAVVGQYGAEPSRPGDFYPRLAEVQLPRNPVKPLTPFFIADILRDGHSGSPSPPPVVPGRQMRGSVEVGRRRSPDSTLRPLRPASKRTDDVRPKTPAVSGGGGRVISRPWDDDERARRHSTNDEDDDDCDDVIDDDEEIEVDDVERTKLTASSTTSNHDISSQSTTSVCPLDALLRMTSQPFDDPSSPGLTIFSVVAVFMNKLYYVTFQNMWINVTTLQENTNYLYCICV